MYVATLPFFPLEKRAYDMETIQPDTQLMMHLFPEIFACVACNSCTKSCSRSLNTMQYIAYAKRNDIEKCAQASFDCVACGICSARCPANISHSLVGLFARRLRSKYLVPASEHTRQRIDEINNGKFDESVDALMKIPLEELQALYNARDIEK